MIIHLDVSMAVNAKYDAPRERALRRRIRDLIMDDVEVLSLDDPGLIIGIIEDVTVTAR